MKHIKTFENFLQESVVNEAKEYTFSFEYNTDADDVEYIQGILNSAGSKAVAEPASYDSELMVVKAANAMELKKAKKAIEDDGFETRD